MIRRNQKLINFFNIVSDAGLIFLCYFAALFIRFGLMQGENVKLDVVSNAKGTYNNDFETNNTAFGAETGIVTYTIDTSGISFAK